MIRKAVPADLPGVVAIYEAVFDQEEQGVSYTNWQRGAYPTIEDARKALDAGTLYVGETDGVLWGAVNLNAIQPREYGDIPWSIPAEEGQAAVIHTLCIHPRQAGKGLGRKMAAFCEETAKSQGRTVIRLDTWEGNVPANRLYPSLGYRFAGKAEFFFQNVIRETLNCYEKPL